MIFFALLATSNAACQGITESPLSRACLGTAVRLGDWRTTPCEDQCNDYLNGREGCCMQKTNKAFCFVYVGGDAEGVRVREHSLNALQAVYCPAAATPGCRTGISDSKLGQSCGYAGVHVQLGDWRTRSCEDQCNDYLSGSEGCCYQKTNKAHCYVVKGHDAIQPAPVNLQAVYCPAVSKQGCRTGISDSKLGRSCGHNGQHVILGDWRTRSCEDQCNDYLSGREGCCYQKTNEVICNVVLGGASAGVMVQPGAPGNLQAVYCPAAERPGCNGISESPLGQSCGHNGVHVRLGDWSTRSCEDLCHDYLSGREGCCYQKTNKAICNVVLGGSSAGINVQPGSVNLQAVYCPADRRRQELVHERLEMLELSDE